MDIQELQPENIGEIIDGQVVLNEGVVPAPEISPPETTPEPEEKPNQNKMQDLEQRISEFTKELIQKEKDSIIPPEKLNEIGQTLVDTALTLLKGEFEGKMSEKDAETQKSHQAESDKKFEDMGNTHKQELDGKDKEINSLKKSLIKKEKEIKELFNQVKEALSEE